MAVIAASILDADYANLEHEVVRVAEAGVDAFTLDVMDGNFVPRITFGDSLVARIRNWIDLPIEVHLMIENPESWAQRYCDAGADLVLFHLEAARDPDAVISTIRNEERCVGVALRHDTPLDAITDDLLREIDLVNLLAVPVGFGGSAAAGNAEARVRDLRRRIDDLNTVTAIEVDGGVKASNIATFAEAGADILTVGTGIYHADNAQMALDQLREVTKDIPDEVARRRLRQFLDQPSRKSVNDESRRRRLDAVRQSLDIPKRTWNPLTSRR